LILIIVDNLKIKNKLKKILPENQKKIYKATTDNIILNQGYLFIILYIIFYIITAI
tara:strand:+ start:776 stop:943 length:168 start_codon:yes stop_codon:yes gene_type:complete